MGHGRVIALSLFLLAGIGCGKDSTYSPPPPCQDPNLNGTWGQASPSDFVTFSSTCVFTESNCTVSGTVTSLDSTQGTLSIGNITATNNTCSGVTSTRSCTYSIAGTTLTLSCGGQGGGIYTKQ